jgi:sulfur transfer protein SufE
MEQVEIPTSDAKEQQMTQMITENAAVDEFAGHQLTALDRCDSCGAQAYIKVTMASGELFFCAHHGARFKDKLAGTALAWHDESSRLRDETRA